MGCIEKDLERWQEGGNCVISSSCLSGRSEHHLAPAFLLEVVLEGYIVTLNENDSPPPPQSTAGVNSSGIP